MADGNVAEQALAAMNLDKALHMRVNGAHWKEIADECGFSSPAAALRAVGEAMAEATQRAEETAEQMLDTANLGLDMLLREALKMMREDAPETYDADGNPQFADDRAIKLRAADEARRLIETKAKLNRVAERTKTDDGQEQLTVRVVGISPEELI